MSNKKSQRNHYNNYWHGISIPISIPHSSLITSSVHTKTSITQCLPDFTDISASEYQSNADSPNTSECLSTSDILSISSSSTSDSLSTSILSDDTLNLSLDSGPNVEIEKDSLDENT